MNSLKAFKQTFVLFILLGCKLCKVTMKLDQCHSLIIACLENVYLTCIGLLSITTTMSNFATQLWSQHRGHSLENIESTLVYMKIVAWISFWQIVALLSLRGRVLKNFSYLFLHETSVAQSRWSRSEQT